MGGKCILCLFHSRDSGTHTIHQCPHAADSNPQFLNGTLHSGLTLSAAKKTVKYPKDSLVCFRCWYPLSYAHPHREKNSQAECPRGDQLPQLCWLLLAHGDRLQSFSEFFHIPAATLDVAVLFKWISVPTGMKDIQMEYTIKMHNIHLLLMWFLEYGCSRSQT
jgi:hypothetical protein